MGNFRNLAAGPYTISVTDSAGQSVSTGLSLSNTLNPPRVTGVTYVYPSLCNSFDGALTLSASGGTPPYSYSQDGLNYQPGNTFSNLSQGYYLNFVKDANGCGGGNGGVFLNSYANCFALSLSHSSSACSNEGTLDVGALAGIPPFQYSLDGIQYGSQHIFDSLRSGLKTVYFRDSLDSVTIFAIRIFQSCAPLNLITTNASCSLRNAMLSVTPSFGIGPYSYTLDGVNYQSGSLFQGLSPGEYTVTVKDANGLIASSVVSFSIKNVPLCLQHPAMRSVDKKMAALLQQDTTAPHLICIPSMEAIFKQAIHLTALQRAPILSPLKILVEIPETTIANVNANCISLTCVLSNAICNNANGSIIVNVTNGTPPYLYSITGVNYQPGNIFNNLSAGYYKVLVTDAANAKIDTTVLIQNIQGPKINSTKGNSVRLKSGGAIQVNASGGVAPLQYSIDGINFQANNNFVNLARKIYHVCK